jgi:hypothetical protein
MAKIHCNMFRTSQVPSSGSRELCLTEVTDIGSVLPFVSCMVSVWLHILTVEIIMGLTHPRRRLDTHCLSTPDVVSTVN